MCSMMIPKPVNGFPFVSKRTLSLLGLAVTRTASLPSLYRWLRLVVFRVNVCRLELLSRCDISTFHTFPPNWWCCLSCTRCVCLLLFERVFYSVSISQCLGPPSAHHTASRLIPSVFYFHHLICGFFTIANENIVYSSMISPHHNAFCFSLNAARFATFCVRRVNEKGDSLDEQESEIEWRLWQTQSSFSAQ